MRRDSPTSQKCGPETTGQTGDQHRTAADRRGSVGSAGQVDSADTKTPRPATAPTATWQKRRTKMMRRRDTIRPRRKASEPRHRQPTREPPQPGDGQKLNIFNVMSGDRLEILTVCVGGGGAH